MNKAEFERRAAEMKVKNLKAKQRAARLPPSMTIFAPPPQVRKQLLKIYIRDFVTEADLAGFSRPLWAIKRLGNLETDVDGLLSLRSAGLDVSVSPDLFVRSLRVYDTVLKAAEEQGWSMRQRDNACVQVVVNGEALDFSVTEKTEPILGPPTQPGRRRPRHPVGALALAFSTSHGKATVSGKRGREVESRLPDLYARVTDLAAQTRTEHERIAAMHRQWKTDSRKRAELQSRIERLKRNVARWEEAKTIREYAKAVGERLSQQGAILPESEAAKWRAWVYRYAGSLDPRLTRLLSRLRSSGNSTQLVKQLT